MTAVERSTTPVLEPVPVEGCGVCEALAVQREEARNRKGSMSVRDCNSELRNHPHRRRGDRR